jgi:hypothetical protein
MYQAYYITMHRYYSSVLIESDVYERGVGDFVNEFLQRGSKT